MNATSGASAAPVDVATWTEVGGGESGARVLRDPEGGRFAKLVPAAEVAGLAAERDRTRWATLHGVPGPRVLHWHEDESGACLITSEVSGIPASEVEAAHLQQAWVGIVDAVRALHALPATDCPFDRGLRHMFAVASDVVARGAVHPEFLRPEQLARSPRDLLTELADDLPRHLAHEAADRVVCHGDLCLPNIVLDPSTLVVVGFLDLGRLGLADRHADLSLLLASAQDTWPSRSLWLHERLATEYGIPIDSERLRFHLHLDPLTWG